MALDMEKMKKKLAALTKKGGGGAGKENFLELPNNVKVAVRILPMADGDSFKDYWFHYELGTAGFLCPKRNFGEPCPVCDFVRALYAKKDEESVKQAKSIAARQRYFSPVLVREAGKTDVKVWAYGKETYQSLIEKVLHPDYGDITDVNTGFDIEIFRTKDPKKQYPDTKIEFRRLPSVLSTSEDAVQEILAKIPEFEPLFIRKTTQEVEELLARYALGGGDSDNPEASSTETTKFGGGGDGSVSVEQAFKELSN